jgi:hypothetical protein
MHVLYHERLEQARACSVVALDTLLYLCCDSAQLQQQARAAGVCQVPGWTDAWGESIECLFAEEMISDLHHYPLWGDRDKHPEAVLTQRALCCCQTPGVPFLHTPNASAVP